MFRVKAGSTVCQGVLKNYEMEGDDLVVRFELRGEKTLNFTLPNFPTTILDAMKKLGLINLKNSTIDLNEGNIKLDESVKVEPGGRQKVTAEKRPGLTSVKGGLV